MDMTMEKAWLQKSLMIHALIFAILYGYGDGKKMIRAFKSTKEPYEEEREGEYWKQLSPEIVEFILLKSSILYYPQMRATCSSWRTIIDNLIADKYYFPLPQFPHILLSCEKNIKVFSLNQERVYTYTIRERECRFVGLIEGWLVLTCFSSFDDSDPCIFFFNPISGRKIMLPPPTTIPLPNNSSTNFFYQVVASCTPDSSSECIVAARVYEINIGPRLVFCRITDESWSLIDVHNENNAINFCSIVIHGNKLYGMNHLVDDYVMIFDLSNANAVNAQQLVMLNPKPHRIRGNITYCNGYIFKLDFESYSIVIDQAGGGEIYMVLRSIDVYFARSRFPFSCSQVKGIRVFKLDLNRPRWRVVDDLGDRLLFVDRYGGKVIFASALNNNNNLLHPNSVYFAHSYVGDPNRQIYKHDIGYFCLTNKTIYRFPDQSNCDSLSSRFSTRSLWFTPTLR